MDHKTLLLGIALGALGMYLIIHFLWHIGYYAAATIFSSLGRIRTHSSRIPKSILNLESMLLPQVQKDFPGFDSEALKSRIRERLQQLYGDKNGFQLEALALRDYRKEFGSHRLSYQAAISWQVKKAVHRQLTVTVQIEEQAPMICCPECGAEVSSSDRCCSFCGCTLPRETSIKWSITSVKES